MALDPYAIAFTPGGSVGANPQPNNPPWETVHGYGGNVPSVFEIAVGGAITNAAPIPPNMFGWRAVLDLADAVGSKGAVSHGFVGGQPGFTRIAPMASLFAGVLPAFVASRTGYWYMETDVRILARVIGDANEFYWVMGPSWQYVNGVIGSSNGFGVVWANTLGANFRLVVADATGVLLVNLDTGVAATVGTHFYIRLEWGFNGLVSNMRVLINDVTTPATQNGPLVLNTANKLGAFTQQFTCGLIKSQASVNNSFDVMYGNVGGLRSGRIL